MLKTYNIIGRVLFTCALTIIGFILAGPLLAIAGIAAGLLGSQFLINLVKT